VSGGCCSQRMRYVAPPVNLQAFHAGGGARLGTTPDSTLNEGVGSDPWFREMST
jgi:hypothetical protein